MKEVWKVITDEELDLFSQLRAQKMTYPQIAERMDCGVKRIDRMQQKNLERTPPCVQKLIRKPWRIENASIESGNCTD